MQLTLFAAALAFAAAGTKAHVTFNPSIIPFDGSYYRATMRLPHGCGVEGADGETEYLPVSMLTVNVPAALLKGGEQVRPEWVAGWPVKFKKENNDSMTITFTGDKPLPAEQFIEFGLTMNLPEHDGSVDGYKFPTTQICMQDGEEVRTDWIGPDVPTLTYGDPCECESTAGAHAHHGMAPGAAPAMAHGGHDHGDHDHDHDHGMAPESDGGAAQQSNEAMAAPPSSESGAYSTPKGLAVVLALVACALGVVTYV